MGSQRCSEDPDPGHGLAPKLIATGGLRGTIDGRPVEIKALGNDLVICVGNLRSAWALKNMFRVGVITALRALLQREFQIKLQIGKSLTFRVLPHPGLFLRFLLPQLRSVHT